MHTKVQSAHIASIKLIILIRGKVQLKGLVRHTYSTVSYFSAPNLECTIPAYQLSSC